MKGCDSQTRREAGGQSEAIGVDRNPPEYKQKNRERLLLTLAPTLSQPLVRIGFYTDFD